MGNQFIGISGGDVLQIQKEFYQNLFVTEVQNSHQWCLEDLTYSLKGGEDCSRDLDADEAAIFSFNGDALEIDGTTPFKK